MDLKIDGEPKCVTNILKIIYLNSTDQSHH